MQVFWKQQLEIKWPTVRWLSTSGAEQFYGRSVW